MGVSKCAVAAVPREPSPGQAQVNGASDRPSADTNARWRPVSGRPEPLSPPGAVQRATEKARDLLGSARTVGMASRGRDARGAPDVQTPQATSVTPDWASARDSRVADLSQRGLDGLPPYRSRLLREWRGSTPSG
jgi:hypothetical protein